MNPALALTFARAFGGTRWGPRARDRRTLLARQAARIRRFLDRRLPRAGFYRDYRGCRLEELPIVDKRTMMAEFAGFNTRGVTLERALAVARAAEESRDFSPTLDGLTVGLSSGTSGTRGVFLVSDRERALWAGILLARVLTPESLARLANPARPPLRVAFFLRANSNLYGTLDSHRMLFEFYDLLQPLERHVARLNARPPDMIAGPPTVLRRLADAVHVGGLRLQPLQAISAAEVLEPEDALVIASAFGRPVQQVYQCTEGLLGTTCTRGRVHLDEAHVHVEPEWLDHSRRFQPVVTDFTRETQLIVRYRLDDVLCMHSGSCDCGDPSLALDAIEGRMDDILWLRPVAGGEPRPVFADVVRRAMAVADPQASDYRIEQDGDEWHVALAGESTREAWRAAGAELMRLADRLELERPTLRQTLWRPQPLHEKRRRIRCVAKPGPAPARALP